MDPREYAELMALGSEAKAERFRNEGQHLAAYRYQVQAEAYRDVIRIIDKVREEGESCTD